MWEFHSRLFASKFKALVMRVDTDEYYFLIVLMAVHRRLIETNEKLLSRSVEVVSSEI